MIGNLKSTLAFAGATLLGAAVLAATFKAPEPRRAPNALPGQEYASAPLPAPAAATPMNGDASYREETGHFASEEELLDDTSGFDPRSGIVSADPMLEPEPQVSGPAAPPAPASQDAAELVDEDGRTGP